MRFRRKRDDSPPPPVPTLSELSDAEAQYIDNQLTAAHLIAEHYLGQADSPPSLRQLDAMLTAWVTDGAADRLDINTVVNAAGAAFGSHLSSDLELDWVIAEDAAGTDLALHGQPGDILIYPANAVAKRLVDGESGFLSPLARRFGTDIRSLRSD